MIYIIHGNDLAKSRTQIINISQNTKNAQKIEIKASDIDTRTLGDAIYSVDLFGSTPFVVLDISDLRQQNISEFLPVIEKTPSNTVLVVLYNKDLGKKSELLEKAYKLKANVILNNKFIKSNIFRFVDSLYLKDRKNAYRELKLLSDEGSDPFYIFSMIIYGLRNIAKIKFSQGFPPAKFQKQAGFFTKDDVMKMYSLLYDIDHKTKTGKILPDIMINYTIEKIVAL